MPFLNNIGSTELVIIGVILMVLFGGKKLSELAKGVGESGKELKKVKKDMLDAFNDTKDDNTKENTTAHSKSLASKTVRKKSKKRKGGVTNV